MKLKRNREEEEKAIFLGLRLEKTCGSWRNWNLLPTNFASSKILIAEKENQPHHRSFSSRSDSLNRSDCINSIYQMAKSNPAEKILSYNDVVLRRSDLDILSGPYFLNDRIIEFYFSHVSSCSEEILLIPPSITFWMMNCPAESLKDFLDPLHLPDKKVVIFPVNDNDDVSEAEGGSHWSLLAFERSMNTFYHHDSSRGGLSKRPAKRLYNAVKKFMSVSSSATDPVYKECTDSPHQVNGYDCGMYVLAIARIICSWYGSKDKDGHNMWFSAVKEQVTPSAVAAMRGEILGLIRGLMPKSEL